MTLGPTYEVVRRAEEHASSGHASGGGTCFDQAPVPEASLVNGRIPDEQNAEVADPSISAYLPGPSCKDSRAVDAPEPRLPAKPDGPLRAVRRRWEEPEEQTRSRMKRVFGIGPKDFASPSSRLIYPLSPFAATWMGITCVCLLYTAIVTPAVISFHWLDEPCDVVPTLPIDCVLDVYFLLDIAVNFCSGVIVRGQYHDDWQFVARHYATSTLVFDLVTSIPVSFVELSIAFECRAGGQKSGDHDLAVDGTQLRFIRILKPLRWLKLARIVKLNRIGDAVKFAGDYFGFEPKYQRMMLLAARVVGLIHLGGCVVWLVKVTSSDLDHVDEFLHSLHDDNYEVDMKSINGKLSAYGICTYFVTTIFSTVGFGDISATNAVERFVFSLLMLYGILVFGDLLAELGEINRVSRSQASAIMEKVQAAADFMHGHDVPRALSKEVFRWTRFHYEHRVGNVKRKEFLDSLPAPLQSELVSVIYGAVLKRVPLFDVLYEEGPQFLSQCWSAMQYENFAPDTTVIPLGEPADRLIVIVSGEMNVTVESSDGSGHSDSANFKSGDYLGDFALLEDIDWGSSTLINEPNVDVEACTLSHGFCVCLVLETEQFQLILDRHSFQIASAVGRFKAQRLQHRLEAAESGSAFNPRREAEDFARSNKITIRWGRTASAFLRKVRKDNVGLEQPDATDSFTKKLQRTVSTKIHGKANGSNHSQREQLNRAQALAQEMQEVAHVVEGAAVVVEDSANAIGVSAQVIEDAARSIEDVTPEVPGGGQQPSAIDKPRGAMKVTGAVQPSVQGTRGRRVVIAEDEHTEMRAVEGPEGDAISEATWSRPDLSHLQSTETPESHWSVRQRPDIGVILEQILTRMDGLESQMQGISLLLQSLDGSQVTPESWTITDHPQASA